MTLAVTDPKKYFYLHQGDALKNLEELYVELQTMEHHVFQHHVTEEKHDFANWVRDVMGDKLLARNMTFAKTKDELMKMLFINLFR